MTALSLRLPANKSEEMGRMTMVRRVDLTGRIAIVVRPDG
jgi:hypothetical protein